MVNNTLPFDTAKIYAPLDRPLNGAALENLPSDTFEAHVSLTPRDDIFAAFDYYLTNINKGERPFILFGHSQGAQLVIELATTFLGNEKYYQHNKNHIITYAIGWSVTEPQINKNPNLKFSENKDDVGVMVSWNTTTPSEVESGAYKNFWTWKEGALITNPITWNTSETPAKATDNKPSKLIDVEKFTVKIVDAFADAVVDNKHNVLVATSVNETDFPLLSDKISRFHTQDIAFYYESVRQNIKDRIAAFKIK
jgi:hypothetical protein